MTRTAEEESGSHERQDRSMSARLERLAGLVRDVPDFPVPGILFKDVTPLIRDPGALAEVTALLVKSVRGRTIDLIAGVESRGFLFGAPLAVALGVGFVPVRKRGKLPAATVYREYSLEYGSNYLEMHRDAVEPGQRVLLVDDVLATGGTARVSIDMIEDLGGEVVGAAFLIELNFLKGREVLDGCEVISLLRY